MEKVLLTCRSMTQAQRAQRLLERRGIVSTMIKTPVYLTKSGCGYALLLRRHSREAVLLLREAALFDGKVYGMRDERWLEVNDDLS